MKPSEIDPLKPEKVTTNELLPHLKKLKDEFSADVLLGSLMTTQGILLLLFSHRYNRDFSVMVSATDLTKVLSMVFEFYGAGNG